MNPTLISAPIATFPGAQAVSPTPQILVVFDERVAELSQLQTALLPGCEMLVLAATELAVLEVITAQLAATGAQQLAIVAHGEPGAVHLGAQPLTLDTLAAKAGLLAEWGVEEIALYACGVGADATFVTRLHQLTGAKVVATAKKVGAATLGGNWEIAEQVRGQAFDLGALAAYRHTLEISNVTYTGVSATDTYFNASDTSSVTISGDLNDAALSLGNDVLVGIYAADGSLLYWQVIPGSSTPTDFLTFSTTLNLSAALGPYQGDISFRFWQGFSWLGKSLHSPSYAGTAQTLPDYDGFEVYYDSSLSPTADNVALNSATYTLDTTAPTAPGLNISVDSNFSGTSIRDAMTISVTRQEAGATLQYRVNGGTWGTTQPSPIAGGNTFEVRQVDVAGNVSDPSTLTYLFGTADANVLISDDSANLIYGFGGNDTLFGGGGNDSLYGGEGNDFLAGGTGNNILDGGAGNDILDGTGGGTDTLIGGTGNDIYGVSAGDTVIEALNEGIDRVYAHVDYALSANVEELLLLGTATQGTGNELDNLLIGNETLASTLIGGAGNDILIGGAGDDTFFGGEGNDALFGGGGNDSLYGGEGNDFLAGGTGSNTLNGGEGNDSLDGAGGGTDTLIGGTGNDIYGVGAGDIVIEAADEGIDRVYAYVNYTLGANVEELILVGTATVGNGNSLDNLLIANTQLGSVLDGYTGNDTLVCGAGNDELVFGAAGLSFSSIGNDTVWGFTTGADKLVLSKSTFADLASGVGNGFSAASDFSVVTTDEDAATSSARVVYNSSTGSLFYNQNGNAAGFGSGGQFASLMGTPGLSAGDFKLVA